MCSALCTFSARCSSHNVIAKHRKDKASPRPRPARAGPAPSGCGPLSNPRLLSNPRIALGCRFIRETCRVPRSLSNPPVRSAPHLGAAPPPADPRSQRRSAPRLVRLPWPHSRTHGRPRRRRAERNRAALYFPSHMRQDPFDQCLRPRCRQSLSRACRSARSSPRRCQRPASAVVPMSSPHAARSRVGTSA